MYTTIARVRTLSGFDDKTNIQDENIKSKILIASGYIDSAIGYVYSLPIAFHYGNSIIFTGVSTGSGTMAVVINGTTYDVAISSGDNANTVADTFRIAAENSADFVTDSLGSGSTVNLISVSTSVASSTAYAQVNITATPTTDGIKGLYFSRNKRFPIVIEQICAEIATSLLFIDEYGVEGQGTGKDGPTRMEVINETLQKLQGVHKTGQSIRIFDEVTSAEISMTTNGASVSYPNDTSDSDTTDPTAPKAFINKEF